MGIVRMRSIMVNMAIGNQINNLIRNCNGLGHSFNNHIALFLEKTV